MQYRLSTLFLIFFVVAASLAAFGVWGIWFAGVLFVAALALHRTKIFSPNAIRNCICTVAFGIGLPGIIAMMDPGEASRRANCLGLRIGMIGLGLLNYESANKHFPPVIVLDKNGKPLRSWMVDILPNLDYGIIDNQLKKDEPWDSPHNAKILPRTIKEYICPSVNRDENDCSSNFMAIIGPGTIWSAEGTKKISDLPNGISYSVMAVEVVDSGKHWAEPFALTVDEVLENMRTGKGPRISTCHPSGVSVLFADGMTRTLPSKMPLSLWRKVLNGEAGFEIESQIDPNAPDMVDVYVEPYQSWLKKSANILSIVVWFLSAAWLFYRAAKSRMVIPQAAADGD